MRVDRLCWDPRGKVFIALTDAGVWRVPNVRGGWAQRTALVGQVQCQPPPGDVVTIMQALGMFAGKLGDCGCVGRRRS